jgi:arylformamidase
LPEMSKTRKWIDISLPVRNSMLCWPDDPPTIIKRYRDAENGDPVTMNQISMISHIGTHIDAPLHFFPKGTTIDMLPLDIVVGTCLVVEIKDPESIKSKDITNARIRKGDRVLFKTANSYRCYKTDAFVDSYVYIAPEAASFLAEKEVALVGLDYISVGSFKKPETIMETHRALLGKGIWILEGLNLEGVEAGRYEFICLPIRFEKGDAGIARAIIRPL